MSQAPPLVATLVERFEQNRESYQSQGYDETQVRQEAEMSDAIMTNITKILRASP